MVEYAQDKGYNICDLAGSDDIRVKIYQKLKELDPIFFFAIGHGNPTTFTDDDEDIVWQCGDLTCPYPPSNLKGRIVYLWSCLTARQLGPKIIEYGGWSYAGFTEKWVWLAEDAWGDPYEDKYARGFFESGNELIKSLLDKKTMQEAVRDSIGKYNEWINYWLQSDDRFASECVKWLVWDRDALTLLGSPTASLKIAPFSVPKDTTFFADIYLYNAGAEIRKDLMLAFGTYDPDTDIFSISWKYIGKNIKIPPNTSIVTFSCTAEQQGTWDVMASIGSYNENMDTFTTEQSIIKEDILTITA